MSACLLCGSPHSAAVFRGSNRLFGVTAEEFAVVRCAECGLMRLDPTPPPDQLGRYYPRLLLTHRLSLREAA